MSMGNRKEKEGHGEGERGEAEHLPSLAFPTLAVSRPLAPAGGKPSVRDATNIDWAARLGALIASAAAEGSEVQGGEGGQVEVAHKGQTGANEFLHDADPRSCVTSLLAPWLCAVIAAAAANDSPSFLRDAIN
ncbi:hypothetical protein HYPSUDRAFT_201540 [Hypholoma sublateritium FD-334 SS-4]|uniref:Uncharacterized protein n=1 Tax=Hypholoma sublateritium (strain FD-334 SS-4) TaxID=945553 RepID=A0A0D2NWV2_HYPSF|nr:hypothetical protein HYPSUDRAFT_201540 [Hypholoma sublateritium FD-334 SS-4]